ncbi:hypothetical protein HQ945_05310 [Phyllobacterium sp. BT25]|uniref:Phage tail assembly chaperone protein, TAC n=1 Tax=Phyllobacterium pellucidum TaxID=2740464 RepID=A0A849VKC7_9HYPH|nr:hypothetical protein [Phyllobacterium pellucidum]NTS30665.1 hypothetical protein [Phyllobacterium pellucidum]
MTKWSGYYAAGAAIGFSPRQIDEMSLWEFGAVIDGYKRANGVEEAPPVMDDDRLSELGIVGF